MTIGNTWLPEDLLYAVAIASDVASGAPPLPPDTNHLGLFGRPTGELLRTFLRKGKRPLVWTDDVTGDEVVPTLLIDPYVGHIAGGRITAADVEAWEAAWAAAKAAAAEGPAEQRDRFAALVASMPAHLRLSYRSYDRRHICAAEEAAGKAVLGIDGMGACVYWEPDRAPPASWEMLNDGTCEPSYSPRPTKQYPSQSACEMAATGSRWRCVRLTPPAAEGMEDVAYCVPGASPAANYTSLPSCEADCKAAPPPRGSCCWNA